MSGQERVPGWRAEGRGRVPGLAFPKKRVGARLAFRPPRLPCVFLLCAFSSVLCLLSSLAGWLSFSGSETPSWPHRVCWCLRTSLAPRGQQVNRSHREVLYPHNLPPSPQGLPSTSRWPGTTLRAKRGPCEAWLWVPVGDCLLRLILSGPDPLGWC